MSFHVTAPFVNKDQAEAAIRERFANSVSDPAPGVQEHFDQGVGVMHGLLGFLEAQGEKLFQVTISGHACQSETDPSSVSVTVNGQHPQAAEEVPADVATAPAAPTLPTVEDTVVE